MKFSDDFFKQRSFEVVWAVFRVGEFVARKDLRELLEQRALAYMSHKNTDTLDGLEEVIKLAVQIGEVRDINGKVLLRETSNLKEAIEERNLAKTVQNELAEGSIENIFGKSILQVSDKISEKFEEKNEDFSYKNESGNILPEYNNNSARNVDEDIKNVQEREEKNESGNILPGYNMMSNDSYERKSAILDLLKRRNMCGMKDIMTALPDISERTLRYDVKGLIDRKLVERVGKGGPNSFLKLRTNPQVR